MANQALHFAFGLIGIYAYTFCFKSYFLLILFDYTGNATGLFLFLSPMVTFKRIVMKKSTQESSDIPYVMTLLNCLLGAWYGLPFISQDNIMVTAINGTGAVTESIYVLIFLIFASKKEKAKILGLFLSILAVFSTIALVSVFGLHESKKRKFLCGFAASIFCIIMYASPLSVTRMVIKRRSVEYMPLSLSLFVFLCGTSWFIYGVIGRDPFLFVPNGFGCGLGAMQLILYAIYRDNKGETNKTSKNETFEMVIGKNYQQNQSNVLNGHP